MDLQDGFDRIVLEKLGVTKFAAGGAPGTVFASDAADGSVHLDGVTSGRYHFRMIIADPLGVLGAANFSGSDFIFV